MPNRYIRDSLNMSKSLGAVSLLAEVLFTHLILAADDYGRYISEPQMLRGLLFSARPDLNAEQVAGALQELERERMIRQYHANERTYLWIVNWKKYQRARAKCSKFPAPNLEDASICKQMPENVADIDHDNDSDNDHDNDHDNADTLAAIMKKGSL